MRRAVMALAAAIAAVGCSAARVEVGPLRAAQLEPLPGVPIAVRVMAQDESGRVVRFAPVAPVARGKRRRAVTPEAAALDPRSAALLRPRAETRSEAARLMVWIDLGPTRGVELQPDLVTLAADGRTVSPSERYWCAGARADDCYARADPHGVATPSATPVAVEGAAWVQLFFPVTAVPRSEVAVRIEGVSQRRARPMTLELRFVRSD